MRDVSIALVVTMVVAMTPACSESTEQQAATQSASAATSGAGAAGAQGAGGGAASASSAAAGGSSAGGDVVVNEISAKGEDWIEIFNAGEGPVDLSGWGVCDSNDDGTPKLDEAARFASGEVLPAGGFLLIVGDVADAGAGPQADCLPMGPTKCYQVDWKVSASMGESVYVVSESDEVLDKADYPANAVLDGQTWGRFPDGTGAFVANIPTPAKANQTP